MRIAQPLRFGAALPVACMAFLLAAYAVAQPQFQNLDFESATNLPASPSPFFGNYLAFSNALPCWTGNMGTSAAPGVSYDFITVGSADISLTDGKGMTYPNYGPAQGSFGVVLQSGNWPLNPLLGPETAVSIAQTGQIPALAKSVRFIAGVSYPGALFVMFNGQAVPLVQLSPGAWGGDISGFQGMTGELRFGAQPVLKSTLGDTIDPPYLGDTLVDLDNITFSTQPIPEPGTKAMLFSGGALLMFLRRRFHFTSPSRK